MGTEFKPTGIEVLRSLVQRFDRCRESFNDRYSVAELLQLNRAWITCEWDVSPDDWTDRQIDECIESDTVPQFCYGRNGVTARYSDGTTGETNREGLTLTEWIAAANVGRGVIERFTVDAARLPWLEGADPTDFAHALTITPRVLNSELEVRTHEHGSH